jgi:8-oxo-dGTP pyrophosphatase MutT (NUDIX family)
MSFLDSIIECNQHDLSQYRRFLVDARPMGWVRHDIAERLKAFSQVFVVTAEMVSMHPALITPEQRTQAFAQAASVMVADWGGLRLKGELYPVVARWGQEPSMLMDRSMVVLFGVPSHGVHVNGYVQKEDGLYLWVGKRAANKSVAPGKLDNMIAGGQPYDLTLMDNLAKEAEEEANVPRELALTAVPVGLISYVREDKWGLRPDVMFCFDLAVPADFSPQNQDGEISDFYLLPVAEVAQRVCHSQDFKLNVNLVIIDFLIRHGIVTPDGERDYIDMVRGLRKSTAACDHKPIK